MFKLWPSKEIPQSDDSEDITHSVNEEMQSGIQPIVKHEEFDPIDVELSQSSQDIHEGDTPQDAIDILKVALDTAREENLTEATITCYEGTDEACDAIIYELKRQKLEYHKKEINGGGSILSIKLNSAEAEHDLAA